MFKEDHGGKRPLHSEEIQRLLDTPRQGWHLREPLESLYQNDQSIRREYQLRVGLVLGLVIYALLGVVDWLLMREIISTVWVMRFGALMMVLLYLSIRPFQWQTIQHGSPVMCRPC